MNLKHLLLFLGLLIGFEAINAQEICPIIPQPVKFSRTEGSFLLTKNTPIIVESELLKPVANYLQQELLKEQSLPLTVYSTLKTSGVRLIHSSKKSADAYTLEINSKGVTIVANDAEGAFYGVVSLLQVARQAKNIKGSISLGGCKVQDSPLYEWRGLMLDESRHFFGIKKVKMILDWMAFYKLNRFHWHLTDEPGWRLEIKKYPGLALIGGIGDFFDQTLPAQYYTQEQIKEVVAYAAQRFITVVPEVDMPGHASAANRTYPEFSGGGSEGHPEFTFNPGKMGTYSYLTDILRETNALFPAGMIHLGGDEVHYGNQMWSTNAEIKTLMQKHDLSNIKEVEKYFMKRMADSVYNMNAKLLVWDEMAEVDLPRDKTIIFWWRHDKPEMLNLSLKKGYETVLCPRLPFYFDFVQDSTHNFGRKANNTLYNSIESVYSFSPDNYLNSSENKQLILGVQADLWSETIQSEQRLDFLTFPRITALAEVAWSKGAKDFKGFMQRLKKHLPLFQQASIYYYDPFNPTKTPEPVRIGTGVKRFNTEF